MSVGTEEEPTGDIVVSGGGLRVRFRPAPPLTLHGHSCWRTDGNSPIRIGRDSAVAFFSWYDPIGHTLRRVGRPDLLFDAPPVPVKFLDDPEPAIGKWIEAVWQEPGGALHGWFHAETPVAGAGKLFMPHMGRAVSEDDGLTWRHRGDLLRLPIDRTDPSWRNGFFAGGFGDLSALPDREGRWIYVFFSSYHPDERAQGLTVLRLSTAAEPLLPLTVVLNPVVAAGVATACFAMGTFIGLSIYVPIWLQTLQGLSVSASGLAIIALMGGTVTGATVSGRIMLHVRHYRRVPVAGLIMGAVALAILAARPSGMPLVGVELLLLAIGLGLGTVLPVTTVGIQNAVPMHQLGTATATMNFFRALGGAITVAAFGAILAGHAGDAQLVEDDALVAGFRWIFTAGCLGLIAALLCLLLMEERPLRSTVASADDQS